MKTRPTATPFKIVYYPINTASCETLWWGRFSKRFYKLGYKTFAEMWTGSRPAQVAAVAAVSCLNALAGLPDVLPTGHLEFRAITSSAAWTAARRTAAVNLCEVVRELMIQDKDYAAKVQLQPTAARQHVGQDPQRDGRASRGVIDEAIAISSASATNLPALPRIDLNRWLS